MTPCLAEAPTDVIVFLLDDARFDQPEVFTETAARLGPETVNLTRAYATSPLCAPSRASLLSGGWDPRHTTVITNEAPDGGATRFLDADTLAVRLQAAGYQTALIGKYLNGSGALGDRVPPGWSDWELPDEDDGWNHFDVYTGSATPTASGTATVSRVDRYITDWQAEEAIAFLRAHPDDPTFVYLPFLAPHHPHTPAAEDASSFPDFLYRDRAYEEADVSDKPAWIASLPLFTADEQATADTANRQRLQTLLSVDRAMAAVIDAVAASPRAATTLFVVTSDNGQMWGEHRLVGKGVAYEESARVPLWLAHPDLRARDDAALVAMNLDIPATILALAGLTPTGDGVSLQSLACGEVGAVRDTLLLQGWPGDAPVWSGLVTDRWAYIESAGDTPEIYDLDADPYEERNAISAEEETASALAAEIDAARGLAIATETLDAATVGEPVGQSLDAWGGQAPLTWSVTGGALPPGVALGTNGALSGTPSEAGTYAFRLTVTDSGTSPYTGGPQSHSHGYTWEIAQPADPPRAAGCGCAATPSPGGLSALLGLLAALRRRRSRPAL